LQWILANGKASREISISGNIIRYVEPLSDARAPHGKRRVTACQGWAGEKDDFFSIQGDRR
jgi:hypothetical protein